MKKICAHILLYLLLLSVALTYKFIETFHPAMPWLHSYLEDIIAIPIIFSTALISIQFANKNWRTFQMSLSEVAIITVLFSVYFEVILPAYSDAFTSDPIDVLCYLTGAVFFTLFLNKPRIIQSAL